MFSALFTDKVPFVLSLAVAILSWFISTILSNVADVTVVEIQKFLGKDDVVIEIANRSIKAPLNDAYFKFSCASGPCISPLLSQPPLDFVKTEEIIPYAIQGNLTCNNSSHDVSVLVSLPPGASIRYTLHPKNMRDLRITFAGTLAAGTSANCPTSDSRLISPNIWVYLGPSASLFIIKNYFYILISLLVATATFLLIILFVPNRKNDVLIPPGTAPTTPGGTP